MLGRVRDAALRPIVMGMIEKAVLPLGNTIRARAGAPPVTSADEFMRRAPLMLVASGKPFEYPQTNWGEAVQMIGPCMYEPTMDAVPDWLTAIDRPIVLVTTSSQKQADSRLVLTAMAALADEPVDVVATSSAPLSEGRNRLHQPKRITADHWSYLRMWADCGHGVGTDRQRANPNLLLGEHLTVVVPQGI